MRHRVTLAAFLLAASLLLTGCGGGGADDGGKTDGEKTASGEELVKERCVSCHDLAPVKSAEKDEAGWRSTVEDMRRRGARLSDPEADEVVDFLAGGGAKEL